MTSLIIGIILFVVGTIFCVRNRWRKIKDYVPLVIGSVLIFISTVGPLSKAESEISRVKSITGIQVASVELLPAAGYKIKSIVKQSITIIDTAAIEQICAALRNAKTRDENYVKSADSAGTIRFNLKDKSSFSLGIKIKGEATRVDINSAGPGGWHYAVLEANQLGVIIQRMAKFHHDGNNYFQRRSVKPDRERS